MFISLYIYSKIRKITSRKNIVTLEEVIEKEKKDMLKSEHNVFDLGFKSPMTIINSKFGLIELFLHGNINSNKTVIFVHGLWTNHGVGIKILDYYLKRNFNVVTFNNLGWDMNHRAKCTFGKRESLFLRDVVLQIKNIFPNNKLLLHGESMGGATVYSYLNKWTSSDFNKIIVDAGYNSFLLNVIHQAKKQLGIFVYLALPILTLFFLFSRYPIINFLNHKKMRFINNLLHLHGLNDDLVNYNSMKKYKNIVNFYTFKDLNVRHVRSYYDSKKEMYDVLDKFLFAKKN